MALKNVLEGQRFIVDGRLVAALHQMGASPLPLRESVVGWSDNERGTRERGSFVPS